jgi:MraZ protein
MPPYSQARDAFATALLGMSEVLRLDAEGRVFFEGRLKTALGLGDEAVFVGQGHKFQIWEPTRFQAHLEQARARVRRLRAERDAQAPLETPG